MTESMQQSSSQSEVCISPEVHRNGQLSDALVAAAWLEQVYGGSRPPEFVRMLLAIARGAQMGPEDGWFGPSETCYTWNWLARLHGIESSNSLTAEQFRGQREWFARLDRNKDERIDADDLDWSNGHPYPRQSYLVHRLFRKINTRGDGRLTREDLAAFFERAAGGKEYLTTDDVRDSLLAGVASAMAPGDAPTTEVLIRGLFTGELGSLNEGPRVGDRAPDFSLRTHDGERTIRLSEYCGSTPVVLVFGNFTCPPFRTLYARVDDHCRSYHGKAAFLAIYVREAVLPMAGPWKTTAAPASTSLSPGPSRSEFR